MSRPEDQAPPQYFYGETEARKYTSNSRIIDVQQKMAERAIELLNLKDPYGLILDLGCGSGLSGQAIEELGYTWVGVDVSQAMLEVAVEREVEGDLMLGDLGLGFNFRPGSFDGAISISAVQWLCYAHQSSHNPYKRLCRLFESLYVALARGARAVLQFYPSNSEQVELITQTAVRSGFMADLVVDFPNSSKAKKYYLILYNGTLQNFIKLPAIETEDQVQVGGKPSHHRRASKKTHYKSRDWILNKKEHQRKQGKNVRPDSKYSGRKRKPAF
jgi:18S rRNA (guanine1575-N7)-methyltransferase